jgi:endonuclease G
MHLTKNQKFGLISFLILLLAAYLVTKEPWKSKGSALESAILKSPPLNIRLNWDNLAAGYPMAHTSDCIRSYTGFDLGYNERYEQASWVVYVLTREEVESGTIKRTDNFRADTSITTGSAELLDYRGSGYDRGHLAPAGDMKWNSSAMSESFLMSNMSPQAPSFNRGIWKSLESSIRVWATEKDSIYVITGPILGSIDTLIGLNEVGVPEAYFKVLVDLSPPSHSMIAFLLPNARSSEELLQFAISVDSLEVLTGYNFFASAPEPEVIEWMEGELDLDSWN